MPEYPPKSRDSGEIEPDKAREERIMQLQEKILQDDSSMNDVIELVDKAAEASDGDSDIAWACVDGIHDMLEKAKNHDGSAPGDNATDTLKVAWQQNHNLRRLCEVSAQYDDMNADEKTAVEEYIDAYAGLQGSLSSALETGSAVTRESLVGYSDRISIPDHEPTPTASRISIPDHEPTPTASRISEHHTNRDSGSESTRAEKLKRRDELMAELAELNKELDIPYAKKLDEYARLLAKEESKRADGFRFSVMHWIGTPGKERKREKRREELDSAGDALKKEVLTYLADKVKTKRRNGEYNGSDDEIAQQMSDEMFDEQRRIFGSELQERKDEILRDEGDKLRNRILAKIGSWVSMKGSRKDSLKAAAVGAGHGFAKGMAVGAATTLFGVSWPISMGAGVAAAVVGDRMIRRGVRLDAMKQNLDEQNGSRQIVNDEQFARIKEEAQGKKRSQKFMANKMLKLSREDSYAASDRLSEETDERIHRHKVALGLGRLVGGAAGGYAGRYVGEFLHDHTQAGQIVDNLKDRMHGDSAEATSVDNQPTDEPSGHNHEDNTGDTSSGDDNPVPDDTGSSDNITQAPTEDFSAYDDQYPWSWVADQFEGGEEGASAKLHELAEAAARDGHDIQWHGYGETEWLSIDGDSNTRAIINTLNKYR